MGLVKHGRMELVWCPECNVPLIRGGLCPECTSATLPVRYTPPGDVRPAFPHDMEEAVELADRQWGGGAGAALFGEGGPMLINPCPGVDRLDEVIQGGLVKASIIFRLDCLDNSLILKKEGGSHLISSGFNPSRGFVVSDDTAVPFLRKKNNLLCPGIVSCHPDVKNGDEVLVLDESGIVIGCGNARKDASEMSGTRGLGVKMRWTSEEMVHEGDGEVDTRIEVDSAGENWRGQWERVVDINRPLMDRKVRAAVGFIRRTSEEVSLPLAVSYSGGKDSLATLLLALDAGFTPPLLFADTGIEFPETLRNVDEVSRAYGLEVLRKGPNRPFMEGVKVFGPPGRDFRWCCKTQKLGPMTQLISEHFRDGVLTLIGQRRYESDTRERKGARFRNPWVPKQEGASPVQNWTALEVWLYIFMRGAPYNELYEKGFSRIGCWLCPSTDLAERKSLELTSVDAEDYFGALEAYREKKGLPPDWIRYGFYRFRKLPPYMMDLAKELGIENGVLVREGPLNGEPTSVDMVSGYRTCEGGGTMEGIISGVDQKRLRNQLLSVGEVKDIKGANGFEVRAPGESRVAYEIYGDGALLVRGPNEDVVASRTGILRSLVLRAAGCIGCGICAGRCPEGAISIETGAAIIDEDRCVHCGRCLGPCPAEAFTGDPFEN